MLPAFCAYRSMLLLLRFATSARALHRDHILLHVPITYWYVVRVTHLSRSPSDPKRGEEGGMNLVVVAVVGTRTAAAVILALRGVDQVRDPTPKMYEYKQQCCESRYVSASIDMEKHIDKPRSISI